MKIISSFLFCFLLGLQLLAQEQKLSIVFPPTQASVEEKQKSDLGLIASRLMEGETIMLYPLAYDSLNDRYTFSSLAKQQAQALSNYATSIGFEALGLPRNFPSSYSGYSVGVILRYSFPSKTPALSETCPRFSTLFPIKPSQFFDINPLRDTFIFGAEGTKLHFRPNCILTKKTVRIELKEYYQLGDYLKAGLGTVSNGKMLQSGGSIYLNATEKEGAKKQVQVNPSLGIEVDFTLGKSDPEMQVFIKDPRINTSMNWILPSKRTVRESWEMTETVLDHEGKIISEKTYHSKEEWEAHQKEEKEKELKRKKAEEDKRKTISSMDSKLELFQLGYINCDKFYNETTMPLALMADANYQAQYYLIYTDIRGVMRGDVAANKVTFGSVAQNRDAYLIAVSYVGSQAYFFKCLVGKGGKLSQKIALKPVDESFLNTELAALK